MRAEGVLTRLRFLSIEDPFPAYETWPLEDESVEAIDIGKEISYLPHAEPRLDLEDGLLVFMREAWRCLVPSGFLTIKAPSATDPKCIADCLSQRYFNQGSWLNFGRPTGFEDRGMHVHDFGIKFEIVNAAQHQGSWEVTMMKPPEGEG